MSIYDLLPSNVKNIRPYLPEKPAEELERELGISLVRMASNENPLGPGFMHEIRPTRSSSGLMSGSALWANRGILKVTESCVLLYNG